MNARTFDALTRRASFVTLGGAGMVPPAKSVSADAKQSTGKKAKKKCKKQVGQCNAIFATACAGDLECLAQAQVCCAFLGACNVTSFIACATTP
jgi:hypothetical protein